MGAASEFQLHSPPSLRTWIQHFQRQLLWEGYHSTEASWTVIWYSVGHLSFYYMVETTCTCIKKYLGCHNSNHDDQKETIFYALLIGFGLLWMRLHGYLWDWLPSLASYRLVLFHVHNRRRLGYWDAKIMARFQQYWPRANVMLGTVAFYCVYLGTMHFYYKLWHLYEVQLWEYYTALETVWKQELHEQHPRRSAFATTGSTTPGCDAFAALSPVWRGATAQWVCHQFRQDESLPGLSLLFHGITLLVSLTAMAMVGGELFET